MDYLPILDVTIVISAPIRLLTIRIFMGWMTTTHRRFFFSLMRQNLLLQEGDLVRARGPQHRIFSSGGTRFFCLSKVGCPQIRIQSFIIMVVADQKSVPNKWRWKLSYVGCPNVPHFLLRLAQSDVSLRSSTHHCRKGAL